MPRGLFGTPAPALERAHRELARREESGLIVTRRIAHRKQHQANAA
jgi:hypothetical protein